ncbi:NADH-quinone oxidoreductase subunit C [Streptomyces sp. NPDC006551]|uniref:NADH-quinone oxidoreductase subunit C n=1 Tax=Streptomyces sp. NPDC006551 TaxID=3157178 RepID=UPI0033BCA76C
MNAYDTLPEAVTEVFGEEATAERAYDLLTVDVPAGSWIAALEIARDKLGCTYFDWLSAVDEPGTGFRVCAHVVALEGGTVRRLLVRTTVPHEAASLPTAVEIYAGAAWHERETHEMFGVTFTDHPNLAPLLLPENFEGHPLRKDFVLAARVAKAWPGAKEPGEPAAGAGHGGPKRRQMLPPGVPDPNDWGPLKGQLPPAPTRPARTARARTTAEGSTPPAATPRRARTTAEGSASQATEAPGTAGQAPEAPAPGVAPRRARTAAEGSASQAAPPAAAPDTGAARPARRSRSVSEGSATQRAEAPSADGTDGGTDGGTETTPQARPPRRTRSAADGSASQAGTAAPTPPPRTRSADAPWHHARPAFDDETSTAAEPAPEAGSAPDSPAAEPAPEPSRAPEPTSGTEAAPDSPAPESPAPESPAPESRAAEPVQAPEPSDAAEPEPGPAAEPERAPDPAPEGRSPENPSTHHPAGGDPA